MVSVADQPGTSTDRTSAGGGVLGMRSNVMWDTFDDVSVDRSSSLADVGRQSEVKLKMIR